MFEIGNSLREARTRKGLDFPELEEGTKIRAKYLRAIENEEWEMLPGPTFVKSFLRTCVLRVEEPLRTRRSSTSSPEP